MSVVIMPKMGDGMEEGTLLRWLKDVGEAVEAGEPLAEIETDKVALELEAAEAGVLTQTMVTEGETVPIGTPIATIGEPGSVPEQVAAPASAPGSAEKQPEPAAVATAEPEAAEKSPAIEQPVKSADNGTEAIAPPPREPGERLRASPIVKRLAAEHGIDLAAIGGTGPGGRIVKDDLTPYLTGAKSLPVAPAAAPARDSQTVAAPGGPRPAGQAREMSRIRRTTGKRMAESKDTIPHFYVTVEVEMGAAMEFREQVNAQLPEGQPKISVNDLIVKTSALALREFPNLNASLEGDVFYDHSNIDINVAVAIENGLIAPFVPDADRQTLGAIASMTKDLISRAREGGLLPEEYQGGTFTISNLGMMDVVEFIAIINPPQAAILAIGSAYEVPVVKDGEFAIGHRIRITLSADHRLTDGAEVARFLQSVKGYLENPLRMVI
ncbi:pyruvate dehydrogenase complex dihydrolipoamide acetyltransferase [soil metagenome]